MTVYRMLQDPAIHTDTTHATRALQYVDELKVCLQRGDLPNDEDRMTHWLLINEVYILDKLGRLSEATRLVDTFFQHAPERADSLFLGKMHMWRGYLHRHQGRFMDNLIGFHEAMDYIDAMPPSRRAHLLLNGASVYWHAGRSSKSLQYLRQAERELPSIEVTEENERDVQEARARRWHLRALRILETDPAGARVWLDSLVTAMPADYTASAHVSIARTYAMQGRIPDAERHFQTAIDLTEGRGNARDRIRALYERGAFYQSVGRDQEAEQDLIEAQDWSERGEVAEYATRIALALGHHYERNENLSDALSFYRSAALITVDPANQEGRQAQQDAQEAALRLAAVHVGWFPEWGTWGALLLAALGAAGMIMTVRSMYARSRDDELGASLAFTEETSPPPPFGPISRYHHVARFIPLPGEQRTGGVASGTLDAGANLSEVAASPRPSEQPKGSRTTGEASSAEGVPSANAENDSKSSSKTSLEEGAPAVSVWDEIAQEVSDREGFEEFPLYLKDVVETLDKESWDILTQCRLYVDTYTRVGIDADVRQARLQEEERRIFRAVMQWLLEDDVWSWMEQVKRDREKEASIDTRT